MLKDSWKSIKEKYLGMFVLLIILLIFFSVAFFYPYDVKDIKCLESIGQQECGGDMVFAFNSGSMNLEAYTGFSCCDDSKANLSSRDVLERMSYCKYYIFLDEDISGCTNTYQFFKKSIFK